MMRWIGPGLGMLALLVPAPRGVLACSLCTGQQSQTLRQEATQAKLVLYGTLTNPRLNGGDAIAGGTTDLRIERVLKNDPFLNNRKTVELSRYVPVDAKEPPRFLIFCDIFNGKLDPYRGIPVKSAAVVDYVKGGMALDPMDSQRSLLYFFAYLDHRDADVANDAYMEFARASDQEIGQVASRLSADKLRRLLEDPQTPANRLGLYGFLLGACGSEREAALLHTMVHQPTERMSTALGGLLSGYIQLRPREGWELAHAMLRDEKKPFTERYAVLGMLRFCQGWKPAAMRGEILRGMQGLLGQGDMADLAIEDLRRWQLWDLTPEVVALYGRKSHSAPIVRRAIVRYALSCPRTEATRFIAELRKQDPELVKDVEEGLRFERR